MTGSGSTSRPPATSLRAPVFFIVIVLSLLTLLVATEPPAGE